jgi:hypothetical protein
MALPFLFAGRTGRLVPDRCDGNLTICLREKYKYLNNIQHLEECAISLNIFTFLEADFFMEKAA